MVKLRSQDHAEQEPKQNHRLTAYGAISGPIYRTHTRPGDGNVTWYAAVDPDLVRKTKATKRNKTQ